MRCSNCGNEVSSNAMFCDNCGRPIEISDAGTVEAQKEAAAKSYCGNCGAKLEAGAEFCGNCGARVENIYIDTNVQVKHAKKRIWMIALVISVVCIAAVSAGIGYMMYSGGPDTDTDDDISVNASVTAGPVKKEQSSPQPSPSSTPTPKATSPADEKTTDSSMGETVISNRTDLYNSSLTYKRMPDIHNTVLVDDKTFAELKTLIEEFDKQCADYMNEITDEVPPLLKAGTTAYNQQVEYKQKHPTLNQSYQEIDVINARQGGGYYYVWVTEVMSVNENGESKETTDHWVYKVEYDNGRWYICDYTSDPAF